MLLVFTSRWLMEDTQPVCKYSNPAQNKNWIQNISNKLITYELIIFFIGQFLSLIKWNIKFIIDTIDVSLLIFYVKICLLIHLIYKFTMSVCDEARCSGQLGPACEVGEGEVCYRQTRPGFRLTGPGVGGGGRRGLLQTDPTRHSPTEPHVGVGKGEVIYIKGRMKPPLKPDGQ
jgi:hypothetical protein